MSIINGIKWTEEVFARLSRPNPAPTVSTLFYKPRKPWITPFDSLKKRRNIDTRNLALLDVHGQHSGPADHLSLSAALFSPAELLVERDVILSQTYNCPEPHGVIHGRYDVISHDLQRTFEHHHVRLAEQ
jgi:hypothetical protein